MAVKQVACANGSLATARKEKVNNSRRSKVINRVKDGRNQCIGIRADGFQCTFRPKTLNGYCLLHQPGKGDPRLKEQRRKSAISKKKRNDAALLEYEPGQDLGQCMVCLQRTLCEDKPVVGVNYVMCLNKYCLQRYALADVLEKKVSPKVLAKARSQLFDTLNAKYEWAHDDKILSMISELENDTLAPSKMDNVDRDLNKMDKDFKTAKTEDVQLGKRRRV